MRWGRMKKIFLSEDLLEEKFYCSQIEYITNCCWDKILKTVCWRRTKERYGTLEIHSFKDMIMLRCPFYKIGFGVITNIRYCFFVRVAPSSKFVIVIVEKKSKFLTFRIVWNARGLSFALSLSLTHTHTQFRLLIIRIFPL